MPNSCAQKLLRPKASAKRTTSESSPMPDADDAMNSLDAFNSPATDEVPLVENGRVTIGVVVDDASEIDSIKAVVASRSQVSKKLLRPKAAAKRRSFLPCPPALPLPKEDDALSLSDAHGRVMIDAVVDDSSKNVLRSAPDRFRSDMQRTLRAIQDSREASSKDCLHGITWSFGQKRWRVQWYSGGKKKSKNFQISTYLAQGKDIEGAVASALEDAKAFNASLRRRSTSSHPASVNNAPAKKDSGILGIIWHSALRCWRLQWSSGGKKKSKKFGISPYLAQGQGMNGAVAAALRDAKAFRAKQVVKGIVKDPHEEQYKSVVRQVISKRTGRKAKFANFETPRSSISNICWCPQGYYWRVESKLRKELSGPQIETPVVASRASVRESFEKLVKRIRSFQKEHGLPQIKQGRVQQTLT